MPLCVAGGVALGLTISNAPVGEIIGRTVAITMTATVHLCFWVTLVFVVLERTGADTVVWTVDALPEDVEQGAGRADLITTVVFVLLVAGVVLWDRFRGFFPTDASPIPVLNPQLWPWGITGLFALLGDGAVLAFVVYARGRWTRPLAAANTVLAVVSAAVLLGLLVGGELVNPAFLEFVTEAGGAEFAAGQAASAEQGGLFRILAVVTGFLIVGIAVWDIVDGWRKDRRAPRPA